jgi:hypothetical protein
VQVPINTTSAPAPVNSDMSAAKASTKASTIPATAPLLICVRYSRKIGISKTVTDSDESPHNDDLRPREGIDVRITCPWYFILVFQESLPTISYVSPSSSLNNISYENIDVLLTGKLALGQRLSIDSIMPSKGLRELLLEDTKSSRW